MRQTFQYATIELMPYPNLGEFVIVGVIALSRGRRLVARVLPTAKTTRLTQFFPEIERRVFTDSLRSIRRELDALAESINGDHDVEASLPLEANDGNSFFNILTSSREGMIRIRARGAAVAHDIERWTDLAYERFVMRTGESIPDAAEKILTDQVRSLLADWKLKKIYRETSVGEDHYHARFPFAYTPEGEKLPTRAIKPLFLAQQSPTKILEHGDAWLQKVRRLQQFRHAPEKIVFPVKLPNPAQANVEDGKTAERREVVDCLIRDFENEGIVVIGTDDRERLRQAVHIDLVEETFFS